MIQTLVHAGLLNAALAGLLAAPAALAACLCRRRPALVHGLWLLVLLKLVTPPLLPVPVPWPARDAGEESPAPEEPPTAERRPAVPEAPAPQPEAPPGEEAPPTGGSLAWETPVFAVWLVGALAVWSAAWARLARLGRVLAAVAPASEEIQERVRALSARLGLARAPAAWLVPGAVPPLLVALGPSPRLLLPAGLWRLLDDGQRDALILHELAHLRRGDPLVRRLELLALGLYWWHPLAWWAARQLREAEELCCDAWVVWAAPEGAAAYAAALVETVAFLSPARARLPLGASGAAPVRSLHRRLAMILRRPPARRLPRPAFLALALAGATVLPLAPVAARPEPTPPEKTADPLPLEKAIAQLPSCLSCHEQVAAWPPAAKAEGEHLHAQILRLMDQLASQRKQLEATEKKLRDVLKRHDELAAKRPPGARAGEKRLDEVEKKLEGVLRELKELRRELKPDRPQGAAPKDTCYLNSRTISLPVRWNEARPGKAAGVFVSADRGQTYKLVARVKRDGVVNYTAPTDGLYYFQVEVLPEAESATLPQTARTAPDQAFFFDTVKPLIEMGADPTPGGALVGWRVIEDNPDWATFKLEYRLAGKDEWHPLAPTQAKVGQVAFTPGARVAEVRLRLADLAGNRAECRTRLADDPGRR
jgi:beta-lactamase regulating signal transducer with metallopeptidase domain